MFYRWYYSKNSFFVIFLNEKLSIIGKPTLNAFNRLIHIWLSP